MKYLARRSQETMVEVDVRPKARDHWSSFTIMEHIVYCKLSLMTQMQLNFNTDCSIYSPMSVPVTQNHPISVKKLY